MTSKDITARHAEYPEAYIHYNTAVAHSMKNLQHKNLNKLQNILIK